jgi:hypothetical protein
MPVLSSLLTTSTLIESACMAGMNDSLCCVRVDERGAVVKSELTAADCNWAASAADDDVEDDSSADDLFGTDSDAVIDLTKDSESDSGSQMRSPSRRGGGISFTGGGPPPPVHNPFDDSTLEMDFDSEAATSDSSDAGSSDADGRSTPPVEPFDTPRLLTSADAELRYERLVHSVGRDLLSQLCHLSRRTQHIADDLSRVSSVTMQTRSALNKRANERSKLFLTESIMVLHEATCDLIALQSHLLMAASLKDQAFDPICGKFSSRDGHFEVDFKTYPHLSGSNFGGKLVKRVV